jgi:hypothetical protein
MIGSHKGNVNYHTHSCFRKSRRSRGRCFRRSRSRSHRSRSRTRRMIVMMRIVKMKWRRGAQQQCL